MLDGTDSYTQYIEHFRTAVIPDYKATESCTWQTLSTMLDRMNISYQIRDITTTITPPSIQEFLSINDFHFNTDVSHLTSETLDDMIRYLDQYNQKEHFEIEVKHKLLVIAKP